MKFNPITKELYTNDNRFIKKMYCPYPSLKWDDLSVMEDTRDRLCAICEKSVLETAYMDDEVVWKLLQNNPDICLKIDWDQENIRIVHHVDMD